MSTNDLHRTTETRPPDATAERLMVAALRLIGDQGYHGATTRAIAAEAGVSEVTLFRRFGNKRDLTAAALAHVTEGFRSVGAEPTDDVVADLIRLGQAYQDFVDRWPGLVVRLLAEVAVQSEIGVIVAGLIAGNAEAVASVIEHHQRADRLIAAPPDDVVAGFLGPILLGATVGRARTGGGRTPSIASFDVTEHTMRFLDGFRASGPDR